MLEDTSFYNLLKTHQNKAPEFYSPVYAGISENFLADDELLSECHDYSCKDYVHYDDVMEVARRTARKFEIYSCEHEFSIEGLWYLTVWAVEERLSDGDYEDAFEYEAITARHNFTVTFGEQNEITSLESL